MSKFHVVPDGTEGESLQLSKADSILSAEPDKRKLTSDALGFSITDESGNTLPLIEGVTTFTAPPTVNDDSTLGVQARTFGYDLVNQNLYWCADNTAGAAVWIQVTSTPLGITNTSEEFDFDASVNLPPTEKEVGNSIAFEMPKNLDRAIIGSNQLARDISLAVNPVLKVRFAVCRDASPPGPGDIVIELDAKYVKVGELLTQASAETLQQIIAIDDVEDKLMQASFTLDASKMEIADELALKLYRRGTNASDDYDGTICFLERARFEFRRV